MDVSTLHALITAKGEEIRSAKASGAAKASLDPLVEELKSLKKQ